MWICITTGAHESYRKFNIQDSSVVSKKGLAIGEICFNPIAFLADSIVVASARAIRTISKTAALTVDFLEMQVLYQHFMMKQKTILGGDLVAAEIIAEVRRPM